MNQISQRELKEQIVENPNLTYEEKMRELNRLRRPYQAMSDEELLQLVRDFVKENDRLPIRKDLIYDTVLKQRLATMGQNAGTGRCKGSSVHLSGAKKEKKREADPTQRIPQTDSGAGSSYETCGRRTVCREI